MTNDNATQTEFEQGDYKIKAKIEKTGFDEEKRISVEGRVELFKDGEKVLTILEDVSSGNMIPDEPDMEDKVFQNTSIWMPSDKHQPSKRVSADWKNDEVSEMNNEEFAEQVLGWIENNWDYEAVFDYEEINEGGKIK